MHIHRSFVFICLLALSMMALTLARPIAAQDSGTSAATEVATASAVEPTETPTIEALQAATEVSTESSTEAATESVTEVAPTSTPYQTPTITPTVIPALAKALIAYRDGSSLALIQASGQGRRVVGNPQQYVYFCPAYSRDGKKLAFIGGGAGYEVYATDGFGDGQRTVVKKTDLTGDMPAGSTTWSPDSKRIAFTGANAGPFYIVGADGKNLTTIQTESFYNIDWSPDGNTFVAFAADKDGKLGIYTVSANGSTSKLLLALPDSDRAATLNADNYFSRSVIAPRWSPDGKQIAFASTKDGPLTLYVMDENGQNVHRVLPSADTAPSYSPSWSPDGQYLVFASDRDIQPGIYVVTATGDAVQQVATFQDGGCPAWQPTAPQNQ